MHAHGQLYSIGAEPGLCLPELQSRVVLVSTDMWGYLWLQAGSLWLQARGTSLEGSCVAQSCAQVGAQGGWHGRRSL